MKSLSLVSMLVCFALETGTLFANTTANQTDDLSPILPESGLPFRVVIEQANFQLPVGIQGGVFALYKGLWVFIAGRTNGVHGFDLQGNFPPSEQNTAIYVVNPKTGTTYSRSLYDPSSGLSQRQIDILSVATPQSYQEGGTLYMTGGYGIDTQTGLYETKPFLTAINIPGIIKWVTQPGNDYQSVAQNISQLADPLFQITGGTMFKSGNLTLLMFGQNFQREYTGESNGIYSNQIRRFQIHSDHGRINVTPFASLPENPDPNYRRRDHNVLPVLFNQNNLLKYAFVAFSGVFTIDTGVWTVPVMIYENGSSVMADPSLPSTFKQAMNQYTCASVGLYSKKQKNMYNLFFGGISYGYYANGVFTTDAEIPFINQVTTIKMDNAGSFTQYLMNTEYPTIYSSTVNPGNQLLFGANAYFIPNTILSYPNGVISFDAIRKPTEIGYIVGGIASTQTFTNTIADSFGSPYVFKVTLVPK